MVLVRSPVDMKGRMGTVGKVEGISFNGGRKPSEDGSRELSWKSVDLWHLLTFVGRAPGTLPPRPRKTAFVQAGGHFEIDEKRPRRGERGKNRHRGRGKSH